MPDPKPSPGPSDKEADHEQTPNADADRPVASSPASEEQAVRDGQTDAAQDVTATTTPTFSRKAIALIALSAAIFAIAFLLVIKAYQKEGENRTADLPRNELTAPNRVNVSGTIESVDLVRGVMQIRLEFEPAGTLTADRGVTTTRRLKLLTNAIGKQETVFPKGGRMIPLDFAVDLYDGQASDYPFDRHLARLTIYFESDPPSNAGGALTPVSLALFGSVHGLRIEAQRAKDNTEDFADVDMKVTRSGTTFVFSIFITITMWMIAAVAVCMTFLIFAGRRKIELGMFQFLATVLFAFPALRNSEPGTPPIGTLNDFLGFFWAEVIIALCLISIVTLWLRRPPPAEAVK